MKKTPAKRTEARPSAKDEVQPEVTPAEEQGPPEPVDLITVVIVSCNRIDALRQNLTALGGAAQNPAIQVIVVDNGSQDGSPSLEPEFPGAQFLKLPQNFGLTKALNIGMRAGDGNYVLFLHDDVEIKPEAVELLRAELAEHPDTGAACPRLLDEAGNPALQLRDLPTPTDPDPHFRAAKPGESAVSGAVIGAAIMVRRFLLNALRHIDERYGNYGSDVELCMQVRRANKKVVIVEGATAIHRPAFHQLPAAFAADRQLGTAAFLGKYHGLSAKFKYLIVAILRALFTFRWGQLRYLVSGQKIDGA